MIRTMSGRFRVVRSFGLMFGLMFGLLFGLVFGLGALAGCDRSQAPGPGPKPISSNTSQTANPGASAPPATQR